MTRSDKNEAQAKMNKMKSDKYDEIAKSNRTMADFRKNPANQTLSFGKQLKLMTKLELCNIYGLNEFRFQKDKKAKYRTITHIVAWAMLIVMLMFCAGGMAYAQVLIGLEKAVPALLIMIASVLIFSFSIFKAGNVIFRQNGYDMLCALPIKPGAVVLGRFLRMYVENLGLVFIIMVPGLAVYAWFVRPGAVFYLLGLISMAAIPFLPLAGAVLVGALITGISSRMKHKSIVSAALSIAAVLALLLLTSSASSLEDTITLEILRGISGFVLKLVGKIYPPAFWMGSAIVEGSFAPVILCMVGTAAVFLAASALVAHYFQTVSRMLYSTTAKHDYRMEKLKSNTVLWALCKREFKRYLNSSVYVTNTIIGPLMGTILAGSVCFLSKKTVADINMDLIISSLPVNIDLCAMAGLLLSAIFCMMIPCSVSISMEGKNWWIAKSLPLSTKTILDAKIMMTLLLILPFYLVSELLLILGLRPNLDGLLSLVFIPAILIVFSSVFGIMANLKLPVLNWESEVSIVKQSAASLVGGMGGFLLAIVCGVILFLLPEAYARAGKIVLCAVILGATAVIYQKNNRVDLRRIG